MAASESKPQPSKTAHDTASSDLSRLTRTLLVFGNRLELLSLNLRDESPDWSRVERHLRHVDQLLGATRRRTPADLDDVLTENELPQFTRTGHRIRLLCQNAHDRCKGPRRMASGGSFGSELRDDFSHRDGIARDLLRIATELSPIVDHLKIVSPIASEPDPAARSGRTSEAAGLNDFERLVLQLLADLGPSVRLKIRELHERTEAALGRHCSDRTVRKAVKKLIRAGWADRDDGTKSGCRITTAGSKHFSSIKNQASVN